MRTQFDHKHRVVALSNLEAMCERVSGTCHRYAVERVTANRCYVRYDNPDEYGNEHPMLAVFPCYPCDSEGGVAIVLYYLNVQHDNWHGEGWQAFEILRDCPTLWRSSHDTDVWQTEDELKAARA